VPVHKYIYMHRIAIAKSKLAGAHTSAAQQRTFYESAQAATRLSHKRKISVTKAIRATDQADKTRKLLKLSHLAIDLGKASLFGAESAANRLFIFGQPPRLR
jgi:hypothetical protein